MIFFPFSKESEEAIAEKMSETEHNTAISLGSAPINFAKLYFACSTTFIA